MSVKHFQVVLLVFSMFLLKLSQPQTPPSIDDPDFNTNIWKALCSNELPAEPLRESFPLRLEIFPDPFFNTFSPGQHIRVTLRGIDPSFDFGAFLIRAHSTFDTTAVGEWIGIGLGKAMSCANEDFEGNDYAAQKNVTLRSYQELIWTAPMITGNYVFNLTTSERFMVYWADQLSHVLRVV
ncbi:CLUMA_CG015197, isoform A [Clunio marinus]|uniref:CLUMA_CG015197, isoform A n=1 Tax=Clunio marinus TaxID=568069 RepID=A0A1J1IPA8_9DIPT|nr:CLUMA_CG015197, isoform A [Clunio marinus]